jgi:pimeloyl-ACP methyl ester carboxylesterase
VVVGGDAVAVLDALGVGAADLVGVSLGASVAVAFAARAPERVGRLALFAANPFTPSRFDALETTGLAVAVRLLGFTRWLRGRALEILFGSTFRAERPEVIAAWSDRLAGRSRRDTWRAVRAWVRRPDATAQLSTLRLPVLVATGSEDAAAPPRVAERVAAAIPGGRAVILERTGHSSMVERPRAVLDLLVPFLA